MMVTKSRSELGGDGNFVGTLPSGCSAAGRKMFQVADKPDSEVGSGEDDLDDPALELVDEQRLQMSSWTSGTEHNRPRPALHVRGVRATVWNLGEGALRIFGGRLGGRLADGASLGVCRRRSSSSLARFSALSRRWSKVSVV